jgi:uracil-DNA glycosylase
MNTTLPASWQTAIGGEFEKPYFAALRAFVDEERAAHEVYPSDEDVFNALRLTPYDDVKVFLLGQDPYHDTGQAHGLSFSVLPGIKPPPSLANIYKELKEDIPGFVAPKHGYLASWAEQGVLLLNAVLTVRAHTPNSHKAKGWETFTDAVIKAVSAGEKPVVFVLWGGYAQKKLPLIDTSKHIVIQTAHPSPLSARAGFFGSKCFSRINEALEQQGKTPIDWQLPEKV